MTLDADVYKRRIEELWQELNPSVENYQLRVFTEPGKRGVYDAAVFLELSSHGRTIKADALLATPDWEVPISELGEWLQRWIGNL